MKKFIAIIAAIAMIATMSVCAFAIDGDITDTNAATGVTQTVDANYVASTGNGTDEIHLDVEWTSPVFEFSAALKYWDEDAKAWKDNVEGGSWTDKTAVVEVATRSSKEVTVNVTYEAAAEGGIAATFNKNEATFVAADANEGLKAETFTLTVTDGQTLAATKLAAGTIKVAVA